jgi:hypothetical protein
MMVMAFLLAGPHLYTHRPQGHLQQRHLHHQKGPGQVFGALREEEALNGPTAVVVPLRQCASSLFFTASAKDWTAVRGIQLLGHSPYLPDLSPADFRRVKEALAGVAGERGWYCKVGHWPGNSFLSGTFGTSESLKNDWVEVTKNIITDDFSTAFQRWFEQAEKMRLDWQGLRREILENKHSRPSYGCLIINTVWFVWQITSYTCT